MIRKNIRICGYDYSAAGAYFVTICTHGRQRLFGEIHDDGVGAHLCVRPNEPNLIIEHWLKELPRKYPHAEPDLYVIMPDHIHFLLFLSPTGAHAGAPLHEIIKWFKTQTTNEYIHGVKEGLYPPFDKHLWQRGYYEHVIRNENDLLDTRQYIENNPLKWLFDGK